MSAKIAIVGGGISGLATAYFLQEEARASGQKVSCTLLEGEKRLGGMTVTEVVDGCVIEGGPDSFLTLKPQAVDLCERLGLSGLLIGTNRARSRVYIFCGGRLRTLPEGLMSIVPTKLTPFLTTDLLTPSGKARMLFDVIVTPKRDGVDESLASFIRRRLGDEALERIAEPLMAGIYAGDAEQLSMQTNFPRLVDLELKHRSLITGTLAARREAAAGKSRTGARPMFMALRGGVGAIVDALAAQLKGVSILTGRKVVALRGRGPYELELEDSTVLGAEAVVLATPAYASAQILKESNPQVADVLDSIPYVSSATVSLAYDRSTFSHPLDGSGFLVAPVEKRRITGCTWVSSKWPSHSPPDRVLLRCFLGRAGDEGILQLGDDELCRIAQDEVKSIMGVSAEPVLKRVHRCGRCLPQYVMGHKEKLEALDEGMSSMPGVFLTGAAFRGVGLPDCIKQAELSAKKALDFVAMAEAGRIRRKAPA
jgi:oxygen-dependent protoporphyrinogen oxidase